MQVASVSDVNFDHVELCGAVLNYATTTTPVIPNEVKDLAHDDDPHQPKNIPSFECEA
jgi:hypothetical protein